MSCAALKHSVLQGRVTRQSCKLIVFRTSTRQCACNFDSAHSRKNALCGCIDTSAKGVINAVPPLFTAHLTISCLKRLPAKSYPVTGINREGLRPIRCPVVSLVKCTRFNIHWLWVLRLRSYLPHSFLQAASQRLLAAALSIKGYCVLLFVSAFMIFFIWMNIVHWKCLCQVLFYSDCRHQTLPHRKSIHSPEAILQPRPAHWTQ